MTITRVLTPAAFVAVIALSASPALAQRRGGGRSTGRSHSYSSGPRIQVRVGPSIRGYGYRPSYVRPYYARPRFARPFYSFRPRVNLGFGIWMGYPVAYPDYYYGAAPYYGSAYPSDVYPSADPYAYGSAPSYGGPAYPAYGGSGYPAQQPAPRVGVQNGQQSSEGGVSFDITPSNAEVFVDGNFVATAGELDPNSEPLGLSAGRHHVEIRASGYRTMAMDADVRAGEVLPFRGALQRN